jgi:hypothetical protein
LIKHKCLDYAADLNMAGYKNQSGGLLGNGRTGARYLTIFTA